MPSCFNSLLKLSCLDLCLQHFWHIFFHIYTLPQAWSKDKMAVLLWDFFTDTFSLVSVLKPCWTCYGIPPENFNHLFHFTSMTYTNEFSFVICVALWRSLYICHCMIIFTKHYFWYLFCLYGYPVHLCLFTTYYLLTCPKCPLFSSLE